MRWVRIEGGERREGGKWWRGRQKESRSVVDFVVMGHCEVMGKQGRPGTHGRAGWLSDETKKTMDGCHASFSGAVFQSVLGCGSTQVVDVVRAV